MIPVVGTSILVACALCAALLDVRFRRLPNWLALVTATAGLGVVGVETGWTAVPWALVHAFVALLVGMILFRFGMVGGGDAKFYAGVAAWWPLQQGLPLLLAVSLAGLILVIVWFTVKRVARARSERAKGDFALVPYGLAIAVGAVATRVLT